MRLLAALTFLLAACSGDGGAAKTASVDINAAAEQAQNSIDHYAATATPSPPPAARTAPAALEATDPAPGAVPSPAVTLAPLDPPAPGAPGGLPDDRTPLSEAPFTADSAQGAADVLQTYYALLGERKYRQAWALWGHGGKDSGKSAQAFAQSFARYSEYHANVGAPGEIDAGMSQRWVTVPIQVHARLKTGAAVDMIGSVTLHRVVAGVGAPKSEQAWRLKSVDIRPRPRA